MKKVVIRNVREVSQVDRKGHPVETKCDFCGMDYEETVDDPHLAFITDDRLICYLCAEHSDDLAAYLRQLIETLREEIAVQTPEARGDAKRLAVLQKLHEFADAAEDRATDTEGLTFEFETTRDPDYEYLWPNWFRRKAGLPGLSHAGRVYARHKRFLEIEAGHGRKMS